MAAQNTRSGHKTPKPIHVFAAAFSTGLICGKAAPAFAQNVNDLVDNLVISSGSFSTLLSVLGYVGGTGLGVTGIFKLKQHVDNPGQVGMREGMIRLVTGGALLTLPFIMAVMQGSVGQGNEAGPVVTQLSTFGDAGAAGLTCVPGYGCY